MKRYILISVFFIVTIPYIFSQNTKSIDSLENILSNSKGIKKVEILCELAEKSLPISKKKSLSYSKSAISIATEIHNAESVSLAYFTLGKIKHNTNEYNSAQSNYYKALNSTTNKGNKALILDNLGTLYKDKNNYDTSLAIHNKSLQLKQKLGDKEGIAISYNNIGNVYLQMRDFDKSLLFYQKALEIQKKRNDKLAIAAILNNIGDIYKITSQYEKALSNYNEALKFQKEIGDKQGLAYTLNGIGNFYFQLKIYDKAQEFYTKALEIRKELGNKNDIAASTFNIATVHRDIGNYKEALKYYNTALQIRRETGAKEAEALVLNAIGGVYKNKKLYGLAIYNYKLALEMHKKIGSKLHIANSYEKLGIIYKDTSLFNKAEEFYNLAILNFKTIHNQNGIARIYNYLGNLYKEKNDFNKSLNFYKKSYSLYDSTKNIVGKAYVANNIGDLYLKFNLEEDAISYYKTAKELAIQSKELDLIQSTSLSLYSIFKNKNKYEKALTFFEEYTALKDTIALHKNLERITELEFESNVKLLEKINENQELKIHQEEIKQSQIKRYLLILTFTLLAIFGFSLLLYRQFSQKKKAFNLLSEKSSELESVNNKLESLNKVLQEKSEKISDSLSYATRIQKAIIPQDNIIQDSFKENFIYYLPKETVSGDFYWHTIVDDYSFIAVVDCTGHGVPGAFMSMIGNTLLNQIVNELHILEPSEILQKLDKEIIKTLHQYDENTKQEDGMEISLIRYDIKNNKITFSGAGHKIIHVEKDSIEYISSTYFSIGGMHAVKQDSNITFPSIEIPINSGTTLYLYSDGYIDQFGGEKDERYSSTRFLKMIKEMQNLEMNEQLIHISKVFEDWKGKGNQIDDVLVIGLKF